MVFVGSLAISDQLAIATEIFSAFWADSATNVIFLTYDHQHTTFYTFHVFTNDTCGSPLTVAHNYYWHRSADSPASGTPLDDQRVSVGRSGFQFDRPLFPKKCSNLFNCPVNVATFVLPPFMFLSQKNDSNHTYFDGIEGIVVRVLSQRIHFTPILVLPGDQERWGACDADRKNCTGALKMVSQRFP